MVRDATPSKIGEASIKFHLSAVDFFKDHDVAKMARYASTPSQTVELFRLNIVNIGEIIFLKQWAIHHTKDAAESARIYAGFYALLACEDAGAKRIEAIVEAFREILTMLSIFCRQAITLHGWEKENSSGKEIHWFHPLEPNRTPYMELEPHHFPVFPNEFKKSAESLINGYFSAAKKIQKSVRFLAVSIAPHVASPDRSGFLLMFSALEQVVGMIKMSDAEKLELGETNSALVAHLTGMKSGIESESPPFTDRIVERINGFIKLIESGNLSFSAKLQGLFKQYPALSHYAADLWPIEGSKGKPGLKEMRNKLTHSTYDKVNSQALAVARWHFSIFIERLVFVLLGAEVPEGIHRDSFLLSRNGWYAHEYWTTLQDSALHA
jgi:hypothetical protein